MIAVSIILLCSTYLLDFTAINAKTNKTATIELIIALNAAKICGSKLIGIFSLAPERKAIPINTMIETNQMKIRAWRSFFFKTGFGNLYFSSIRVWLFFLLKDH